MKVPTVALAALLFVIPTTQQVEPVADDPRVKDALNLLDVWFDAQQAYHNIPGISAAVVYDQELLWSRGFGYAALHGRSRRHPRRFTASVPYRSSLPA